MGGGSQAGSERFKGLPEGEPNAYTCPGKAITVFFPGHWTTDKCWQWILDRDPFAELVSWLKRGGQIEFNFIMW